MEWRNQVAVVTGGSRGIGRATARLFAQRGAAVCVNYAVNADAAEALVAEITTAGGRAIAVAADVADSAAVEAMVARTEAELGPVTILVNNAGVAWRGTLDTYDREQVARILAVAEKLDRRLLQDLRGLAAQALALHPRRRQSAQPSGSSVDCALREHDGDHSR